SERGVSTPGIPDRMAEVLGRLQGVALPIDLWEQSVLPARVPGYSPRWLDDWVAGGSGVWVFRGENVAFYHRGIVSQLSPDLGSSQEESTRLVAETLHRSGAAFLSDLAIETGLAPSDVRKRLWELARCGLVSCDRVEVARRGEPTDDSAKALRPTLRAMRRQVTQRPEGRWQLLKWGRPTPEERAIAECSLLLERYGLAARELASMDDNLLPWRVLYEVLSRLELSGEVRRGYFVEGLSGAQFALPEAFELLIDAPSTISATVILVHSMDPANLYGAGAPFDVALLDGGTRSLLRRPGNWVALKAGRPILLVEAQGKKITALPSASREDITAAVKTLPGIFERQKDLTLRHKLTVEEWNGTPVTAGPGRELLEAAGFVRDYNGMTLYAAWR
ncbi:MAG: hypothetical protein EBV06_12115, partial [Planctomycetia bacterium]|nr:hypothetical protein [Planctomycetia bacterium]